MCVCVRAWVRAAIGGGGGRAEEGAGPCGQMRLGVCNQCKDMQQAGCRPHTLWVPDLWLGARFLSRLLSAGHGAGLWLWQWGAAHAISNLSEPLIRLPQYFPPLLRTWKRMVWCLGGTLAMMSTSWSRVGPARELMMAWRPCSARLRRSCVTLAAYAPALPAAAEASAPAAPTPPRRTGMPAASAPRRAPALHWVLPAPRTPTGCCRGEALWLGQNSQATPRTATSASIMWKR